MKAVVIGGGFGGLASAALLAKKGYKVELIEKNIDLGGRARRYSKGRFTFDMGPSWYLMPEVFDRFFEILGFRREDFFSLKKLNPSFEIITDKNRINVNPDLEKNRKTLDSLEENGYSVFSEYLDECAVLYRKTMSSLLYRNFDGFRSMVSPSVMKSALGMKVLTSMGRFNGRYFRSREMQYLSGFSAVFLGGDPSSIPAVYSMVNHSIFRNGVFYPEGGFGTVVDAMVNAGEKLGVNYITGEEILNINVSGDTVISVSGSNGKHDGDMFLFNADYHHVEQNLLEPEYRNFSSRYWKSRDVSPSAILAYIGLEGKLDLQHHTIVINDDWNEHFSSIRNRSETIPDNFAFYVSLRSRSDQHVAPEGCENMFLLIPVSANFTDTEENRDKFLSKAIERLGGITGTQIKPRILYMRTYCRSNFKSDYNAFLGSAFGLSQTLGQTAGMRPSMRNRKLKNMFYVGQYTHPGIGVPMTLISAEIASALIADEFSHGLALPLENRSLADRS